MILAHTLGLPTELWIAFQLPMFLFFSYMLTWALEKKFYWSAVFYCLAASVNGFAASLNVLKLLGFF